jgi:ribosomal protein L37AE/L43A
VSVFPSELFKGVTMTPLQKQVAETGRCPFCHTKRLKYIHTGGNMDFHQCSDCLKVFVLPEIPKLLG